MSPLNYPDVFFLSCVRAVQEITAEAAAEAVPEYIPSKYVQDFLKSPDADTVRRRICDLLLHSTYFLSPTDGDELLVRRQNKESSNTDILKKLYPKRGAFGVLMGIACIDGGQEALLQLLALPPSRWKKSYSSFFSSWETGCGPKKEISHALSGNAYGNQRRSINKRFKRRFCDLPLDNDDFLNPSTANWPDLWSKELLQVISPKYILVIMGDFLYNGRFLL